MRSILALALLVVLAEPALAHRLKVFAAPAGTELSGRVYFIGAGGAAGIEAVLTDAAGTVVGTAITDDDGRFTLALPYRDDFSVSADAGDGHADSFSVPASRLAETLPQAPGERAATVAQAVPDDVAPPASTPDADLDAAIARQLAPLLEEIDALRADIRLRDLLGGIGYILGVFGLWALWRARHPRRPSARRPPR